MLSSVSKSMRWAFLLMDMTDNRTSMEPWSFPLVTWERVKGTGAGVKLRGLSLPGSYSGFKGWDSD